MTRHFFFYIAIFPIWHLTAQHNHYYTANVSTLIHSCGNDDRLNKNTAAIFSRISIKSTTMGGEFGEMVRDKFLKLNPESLINQKVLVDQLQALSSNENDIFIDYSCIWYRLKIPLMLRLGPSVRLYLLSSGLSLATGRAFSHSSVVVFIPGYVPSTFQETHKNQRCCWFSVIGILNSVGQLP